MLLRIINFGQTRIQRQKLLEILLTLFGIDLDLEFLGVNLTVENLQVALNHQGGGKCLFSVKEILYQ